MTKTASVTLRRLALVLLIGLAGPVWAQAQAPFDGSRLPASVDTFTVTYAGNVLGRGVMARGKTGDGQLRQVYQWQRTASTERTLDTLVSDARSLAPIRETRVVGDTIIVVQFARDSIRTTTHARGSRIRYESLPAGPETYSSASLESLAAAAKLSPGFRDTVQVYYAPPSEQGLIDIELSVRGSERVRDPGGAVHDAWVVDVGTPGGGTTFWISKTTRAVIQYQTREGAATIEFRR